MQSLNDDMDRLFRRAAEGYPLDTGSADWDKVQSMLAQDTAVVKPVKNDRRKLLWLLLLLPFGFLCNQYVFNGISYLQKSPINIEKRGTATKQLSKPIDAATTITTTKQVEKRLFDKSKRIPEEGTIQKQAGITIQNSGSATRLATNTWSLVNDRNSKTPADKQGGKLQNSPYDIVSENIFVSLSRDRKKSSLSLLISPSQFLYTSWPMKPMLLPETKQGQGQQKITTKRFYAGVMGGLDATTIKMQKVDALGYSAGILLGYDLSKKWSLETGLFMDKKFYYTRGEYFNTSKIYMPGYYKILTVTGDCRMWEVPVTAKYTIRRTATASFFSTAGASSYFMKKESYDYDYKNTTTGQEGSYYKSYTNSSNRFFSVIHLSAGYTHQLGRVGDLRIEPYVKIPVQKVGIGQMPITSGGIQVGITRRLF